MATQESVGLDLGINHMSGLSNLTKFNNFVFSAAVIPFSGDFCWDLP